MRKAVVWPALSFGRGANILRMNSRLFLAAALLAAFSSGASAETFRCGSRVVSSQVSVEELLQHCGAPSSRTSSTEDVRARNHGISVVVGQTTTERWIYERGTSASPMVVTIVDGKIKSIERKR